MTATPRLKAVKWILRQLDMGVARTQDAEVQAELVQEKVRYQREQREIESVPRQLELINVAAGDDDESGERAVNFSKHEASELPTKGPSK